MCLTDSCRNRQVIDSREIDCAKSMKHALPAPSITPRKSATVEEFTLLSRAHLGLYLMALSSKAAETSQLFWNLLALFPRGHYCTLPEPKNSVPRSSAPRRNSISKESWLPLFVSSTLEI